MASPVPTFSIPSTGYRNGQSVDLVPVYGTWMPLRDGFPVFTRTWSVPEGNPILGTITFIHGLGEHIDRYQHFFPLLAEAGFQVFSYDQRGFGRTGLNQGIKKLGYTYGFDVSIEDAKEMIEHNTIPGKPRFLYGHSMGGLLVLEFIRRYGATVQLNGVIASSPAIQSHPNVRPSPLLIWTLRKIKPFVKSWLIISNEIDARGLCHDDAVIKAYKQDPLVHPYILVDHGDSLLIIGQTIDELDNDQVKQQFPSQIPLLLVHGEQDPVTYAPSTVALANKVMTSGHGDVTMMQYKGMYHELHNEPDVSQLVMQLYIDWLNKHK